MGYPPALYRGIGHPVTWMGAWLAFLEARLNRPERDFAARRRAGFLALALYLAPVLAVGLALQATLGIGPLFLAIVILFGASLPAQRSLDSHVAKVAEALKEGGETRIDRARIAVSQIVGRDVAALDEAGIARAAIESLAENFSDGVVAPLFWMAAGGLPGGLAYKAVNTADSMIGHRNERHAAFGFAAAKLDDLVNLPASRLSALFIALAAGERTVPALRAVLRDASKHRSPNAGWPEAAMAGALGLQLAGPRVYGGIRVDDPFMGYGWANATGADIDRALTLFRRAAALQLAMLALAAFALLGR